LEDKPLQQETLLLDKKDLNMNVVKTPMQGKIFLFMHLLMVLFLFPRKISKDLMEEDISKQLLT
jgi:hypothetical protein